MTSLQEQAKALGDPTRHRIFRYIADAGRPVEIAELTAHFGLNHNAIRQHVAKLVTADLVVEGIGRPAGPGRPRLNYELSPRVQSRWDVEGPYERLSVWLAEMVRTNDTPVEVGRRAGARQRLGVGDIDDPVALLADEMARHGFDPVVTEHPASVDIVLRSCPFVSTALADPDTVCSLHLGMAQGIADTLDGVVVDELIRRDPRRAQCRLRCRRDVAS